MEHLVKMVKLVELEHKVKPELQVLMEQAELMEHKV
jgi:hypothetical protein